MDPKKIILHHSLTKDFRTVSWNAIRRYHVDQLHWRDIGYHFGIELVGDVFETFIGRDMDVQGAHTRGQNSRSIGICFVGNFDNAPVPSDQWRKGIDLVRWIMREKGLSRDAVFPHSAFAEKTCPGLLFDYVRFIAEL